MGRLLAAGGTGERPKFFERDSRNVARLSRGRGLGACDDAAVSRVRDQTTRRAQLLRAASRAVLDRGVAGVRLRDIAQEAGLTSGAVLYYYADVEELLTEVFGQGTRQYCVRREERVAAAAGPPHRLRACIASGVPRPDDGAAASRLLYELMPVVVRNPRGAELYADLFTRQANLYAGVLEQGRADGSLRLSGAADALGRDFVALEDGYGILVLTGALSAAEVERRLLGYARVAAGLGPADSTG
jgi:AcrR family transcriptional regulator